MKHTNFHENIFLSVKVVNPTGQHFSYSCGKIEKLLAGNSRLQISYQTYW